jgi:hypothetical protein
MSDVLPEIPAKYQDRVLGPAHLQQGADASLLDPAREWKPIAIAIDAQDIGRWFASKLSPAQFNQELLARFKAAGAPVEFGPQGLRLAFGRVAKVRANPARMDQYFRYVWLPADYVKAARLER